MITAAAYTVGDVIRDADGNPAVVFQAENGRPLTICLTAGPDAGTLTEPPACLDLVTDKTQVEQARAIGRETWRRMGALRRPGAPAPVPPAAVGGRTPTAEQAAIIAAAAAGQHLVVNAYAGSGKTTILVMIAVALSRKSLTYLAYNKAAKQDAKGKFPRNATCWTTHGLAFQPMIHMARRVGGSQYMSGAQLAKLMGITRPARLTAGKVLAPGQLASVVKATIKKFCHSSDETITRNHVPRDMKRFTDPEEITALQAIIPPIARRVWEQDITTADGVLPMDHDWYLKAYALTHPVLPGEVILLDEAQDSNPCVAAMVLEQIAYGKQVIMTGDTYQAIYEWRGATDAMKAFSAQPDVTVLHLTQSFRFGPAVAAEGMKALRLLGAAKELRGFERIASRVGVIEGHPDAVLCRTNAEAFRQAIHWIGEGLKVAFPKGAGELLSLVRAAKDLKAGQPCEHPDLMMFTTWGQLQDFVATEPDGEDLRQFVDLVDEHGVDELSVILAQIGDRSKGADTDITISTVHGAKGLEWETVEIAGDFREPKKDPERPGETPVIPAETLRLIYVALTRAQLVLNPHGVAWIDHYLSRQAEAA
jgi:UvrD-like helicase family protein/AAA domain-containing protein